MSTHLSDLFDPAFLDAEIKAGYVRATTSQDGRVQVLNYTEKAQYEPHWNVVTRNCRGLVVNPTSGQVLARGFPKFFNLHDHAAGNRHGLPPIPDQAPVDVSEKVDGSLGILVHDGARWRIVTRGSADSEQAGYATDKLLPALWVGDWAPCDGVTYLFEIVYPSNRIVVDYGRTEALVFLAALDTATGRDVDVPAPFVRRAERYPTDLTIDQLPGTVAADEEGYVVRWANGTRVKVKGAEYVRLHAIVTMCSSKTVWEHLSTGKPLDELLDRVPDEFEKWLRSTVEKLNDQQFAMLHDAQQAFAHVCDTVFPDGEIPSPITREDRKAFAAEATQRSDSPAAPLFMYLDGATERVERWAWQQVKPEYARPFADGEAA